MTIKTGLVGFSLCQQVVLSIIVSCGLTDMGEGSHCGLLWGEESVGLLAGKVLIVGHYCYIVQKEASKCLFHLQSGSILTLSSYILKL